MSHSNTALHQLLKPLSRHEFEAEAKKHHVGQKLRSATRWDQFVGMPDPPDHKKSEPQMRLAL